MTRALLSILLLLLVTAGCTMPRVIVLNDPLTVEQHNDLGVAYEQREEFDLALREYARAAKMSKTWARPLINRGNVQAGQGQWQEAAKSYRQALKREPAHAEGMNNLAWVLLQANRSEDALRWAQQAVVARPEEPVFLDTLAEIHLHRKEYQAALGCIEQALSLSPSSELRRSLEMKRSSIPALPK
jgi:tetratricopeptide (TPR) repeat protein